MSQAPGPAGQSIRGFLGANPTLRPPGGSVRAPGSRARAGQGGTAHTGASAPPLEPSSGDEGHKGADQAHAGNTTGSAASLPLSA